MEVVNIRLRGVLKFENQKSKVWALCFCGFFRSKMRGMVLVLLLKVAFHFCVPLFHSPRINVAECVRSRKS